MLHIVSAKVSEESEWLTLMETEDCKEAETTFHTAMQRGLFSYLYWGDKESFDSMIAQENACVNSCIHGLA
jgi:hypothetical protein